MKQQSTDFLTWCQEHATEEACQEALAALRWRDGFACPKCGHGKAYRLRHRHLRQCAGCGHQTSPTAGTVFDHSRVPLTKWFAAIYLMSADKGGISAQRLSKMIGVQWRTAHRMLRKLRHAMGDRDNAYLLDGLVELDDAYVGGRRPGKRGRGAEGKKPVLFAVERRKNGMGFMTAQVAGSMDAAQVRQFAQRIAPTATVRTDGFTSLKTLTSTHDHRPKVTPPEKVGEWLPSVHIVISNFKRYVVGTFHGVSHRYLQEYIDEFVYRFNRRYWEPQLPLRLLQAAVDHAPVRL